MATRTSKESHTKKWRARVKFMGSEVFLGYYHTPEEASQVERNYRRPRMERQREWMEMRGTGLRSPWKETHEGD